MKTVIAENLVKTYNKGNVKALDGLSLDVEEGTVLSVLGPNGAGKTTTVRILATLLTPNSGHASVSGIEVIKHPERVREVIGLSGQYDYLIKIVSPNIQAYNDFLLNKLSGIPNIAQFHSNIVLGKIKHNTPMPLTHLK